VPARPPRHSLRSVSRRSLRRRPESSEALRRAAALGQPARPTRQSLRLVARRSQRRRRAWFWTAWIAAARRGPTALLFAHRIPPAAPPSV